MTYRRPTNMTCTDMCMYFDAHIYRKDRDDNILYQYLYHFFYMLASKAKAFKTISDYDEFALYAATRLYMRYPSKDTCEDTAPEKRFKSMKNYAIVVFYPLKVDYQRETFAQICRYTNEDADSLIDDTKTSIQKDYSYGLYESIVDALKLLPQAIKKRINETPYKNDITMSKKLYMSCLLTFINSMTIGKERLDKIQRKGDINEREELFIKCLQRERVDATMVWHLDDTYKDYILILTNKVRRDINNDITETQISFSLSDSELDLIMASAFSVN